MLSKNILHVILTYIDYNQLFSFVPQRMAQFVYGTLKEITKHELSNIITYFPNIQLCTMCVTRVDLTQLPAINNALKRIIILGMGTKFVPNDKITKLSVAYNYDVNILFKNLPNLMNLRIEQNKTDSLSLSECTNLRKLIVISSTIQHIELCSNLRQIMLINCHNLRSIEGLKSCTHLRRIVLNKCPAITDDIMNDLVVHTKLTHIEIIKCDLISFVPKLAEQKYLKSLILDSLAVTSPLSKRLKILQINTSFDLKLVPKVYMHVLTLNRAYNMDIVGEMKNLILLRLCGCVPHTLNCENTLRSICLVECDMTHILVILKKMQHLTEVRVQQCPITNISGFKTKSLEIRDCNELTCIEQIEGLVNLEINKCDKIMNLDWINSLILIECLTIYNCSAINNIDSIGCLVNLRILHLDNYVGSDVSVISKMVNLIELILSKCNTIIDMDWLKCLTSLENLEITECDYVNNIVIESSVLQSICINECSDDLKVMIDAINLKNLNIDNDFQLAHPLENLESLHVGAIDIVDLNIIGSKKLEDMSIICCDMIIGIDKMHNLKYVQLDECKIDLRELEKLKLEELIIDFCHVLNVESLKYMNNLEVLIFTNSSKFDSGILSSMKKLLYARLDNEQIDIRI